MRSERAEFTKKTKLKAWARCKGICECGCRQKILTAHYDHYPVPAALGGPATLENCRVLEAKHHMHRTATHDVPEIARSKRIEEKRAGVRKPKGRPLPGTKASGLRKRMDGRVERRG